MVLFSKRDKVDLRCSLTLTGLKERCLYAKEHKIFLALVLTISNQIVSNSSSVVFRSVRLKAF